LKSSFWSGKNVLVTGHTGFKGAWLTFWLNEMGAKVHGIGLEPSTKPNAFSAMGIESLCTHHIQDIRDSEALKSLVKKINPQVVFHMAAQPLVRLSYSQPLETYATNVMGTANLLTALRDCTAVKSIIVVTSDKCYENQERDWAYRESDPLGGYDPYSSSKACTEILTASFRRSFFTEKAIGVATVRAGNVIGGGDWSGDRLIPDIVRAMQSGIALEIRYPQAIRPWQHVLMPLSGYITLAEKSWGEPAKYSEAFNFAPQEDDCVPVQTIIEKFGGAWGKPVPWKLIPTQQPHEAHFLKLDSSKSKKSLGWNPIWNLSKALGATAGWYREFAENPKGIAELTRRQIFEYCEIKRPN
jgi:CDP-glucose 4,6-dehydratase